MKSNPAVFFYSVFKENRGDSKTQRTISYLTWLAIAVAIIGSILSSLGICTGGCTDAERYRFFGAHFAAIGIPFFLFLAAASFGRNSKRPFYRTLYDTLLPGVAGAEWFFLGVQARIIKSYCPVCVAIAIAVFVAVALRLVEIYLRRREGISTEARGFKSVAKSFGKSMLVISSLYIGLVIALLGTSLPVEAGPGVIAHDIWLGKADSNLEVLVVSDWLCPYCHAVEPVIESMLPTISKIARYSYIDDPLHEGSYNYIPANMSLLLNSKLQYAEARKVLLDLAGSNKAPTHIEVTNALKNKGIILTLADGEVLKQLARSEAGFLQENHITLTPTVVVRNIKTGARKMLVGSEEITRDKLTVLLTELGNQI